MLPDDIDAMVTTTIDPETSAAQLADISTRFKALAAWSADEAQKLSKEFDERSKLRQAMRKSEWLELISEEAIAQKQIPFTWCYAEYSVKTLLENHRSVPKPNGAFVITDLQNFKPGVPDPKETFPAEDYLEAIDDQIALWYDACEAVNQGFLASTFPSIRSLILEHPGASLEATVKLRFFGRLTERVLADAGIKISPVTPIDTTKSKPFLPV